MKRVLFVCSKNRLRSPTAEAVFVERPDIKVLSAGLNKDSDSPLTPELVAWADIIFVMEAAQRKRLQKNFGKHLHEQRVIALNIPDNYTYMQPELVDLLERKVGAFLSRGQR